MADQEKSDLNLENLEVTELEDESLEDAAGGGDLNINCPCSGTTSPTMTPGSTQK